MVKKSLLIGGVLGMVASVGCAEGPSLRARSAGDLHCPPEAIKIFRLDDRAYRVVGCEQEVVYVSTCDLPEGYVNRKCTWVANTSHLAAKPAAVAPPPAAAPGCSFDTQCKGDRVCVHGECVTPPSAAPNGASPP